MGFILAICALFGGAFASFGCALGFRFLKFKSLNKDILLSRSCCDKCSKKLGIGELLPIFSYIFLRAKCKKCKEKIDFHYFLFEILGSLFAIFCFLNLNKIYPIDKALLLLILLLFISSLLLALSLIDAKLFAVPNLLLYPCVLLLFAFGVTKDGLMSSLISGIIMMVGFWLIAFVTSLVKKQSVSGSADIWLILGFGFGLGVFKTAVAIYIAAILSLVFMFVTKNKKSAFIPFLSIGFCASLIFEDSIKSAIF